MSDPTTNREKWLIALLLFVGNFFLSFTPAIGSGAKPSIAACAALGTSIVTVAAYLKDPQKPIRKPSVRKALAEKASPAKPVAPPEVGDE